MQDAANVICEAAAGHVEDIAARREISERRMYEILGKDNPYPKSKRLIRDIGEFNKPGVRLIKADMDSLFADLLRDESEGTADVTVQRVNKEAFEAIDAMLSGQPAADQIRELRELIAVCQEKLTNMEKLVEREPLRVA